MKYKNQNDVYSTFGDDEVLNQLEQRFTEATTDLREPDFGLENVIARLRDIEIILQKDRFDKEQLHEGDYYELALARYLSEVNKRFPEDTIPHLRPWEDKQLPDGTMLVERERNQRKQKNQRIRKNQRKQGK